MRKLTAISKFLPRSSASWRILRRSLIFIVMAAWLFGGWPPIWQNPRIPTGIQEAEAAINQTTYFSSTASAKITSTVSWQILTTAPASSNVATSCKYKTTTGYCQEPPGVANTTAGSAKPTAPNGKGWIYDTALNSTIPTGTWTFNIRTTNSASGGTGYMSVCAWKVKVASGAITSSTNIINCVDGATNLQANTTALYVSSVSVTGVAATSFAADEYLYVEYWLHTTVAGSGSTAKLTFEANAGASDDIVLPGASTNLAPIAPSQDSPTNSATGVSVTPTFLMTATDPESNSLGYKVTIYSNSACTTIVGSAHDQSTNSTGWSGTNATCTASPTSCYTSGTQGSFALQSADALANSTQYWWKASAKDPDGSGTFTDSSTCNTFTTAAAASLTFVVSTDNFPTLTPGFPVFATSTLSVDTTNALGWNVTVSRDTAAATMALNTDSATKITDQTDWIPGAATTTAGNAVRISSFINSGDVLAFRVMTASGTASFISTAWWGTTDAYLDSATTLWAGIASSTATNLKIGNSSVSSGGSAKLNTVLYYLDVPSTQKSGAYSGGITFTATMN